MVTNLDGYNKQVTRFASNYAKSLMDAVNSAISESASDTGLSNEVMDALMGEFSNLMDVQDYDFSSLFYKTANGIKVNANELKKLIEIQKTAFSEKTKKNITDQNNLINEQAKYYVKDGDAVKVLTTQTLRDHDRKMDALRSELAQYNEIMESIEKSTDLYAQWQQAQSSENLGARYDSIVQAMIEAENAYNRGETDTDEFKALTRLFSSTGLDTADEFRRNYDFIARYFNDNREGIENFLADLQSKGFGLNDVLSTDELAKSFGTTDTAIQMILDKLHDYGYEVLTVKDELDASAQIMAKTDEMMQLIQQRAVATNSGDTATAIALSEQIATLT